MEPPLRGVGMGPQGIEPESEEDAFGCARGYVVHDEGMGAFLVLEDDDLLVGLGDEVLPPLPDIFVSRPEFPAPVSPARALEQFVRARRQVLLEELEEDFSCHPTSGRLRIAGGGAGELPMEEELKGVEFPLDLLELRRQESVDRGHAGLALPHEL